MKLITGLGNPGKEFQNTRHNAGFSFIDALHDKFQYDKELSSTDWKTEKMFKSDISFLKKGSQIVAILQKPNTYMNLSGDAVSKIIDKFEIEDIEKNFILIHDDLDIPLGKFKIQVGKSPVGHNGVNDVVKKIGENNFKRVRIGIENRQHPQNGDDFVIDKFTKEEKEQMDEVIQEAIKGILSDILL